MDQLLSSIISILFHGMAYAMMLYIISVGLSVTMGLMGFANLAHGVFAMAGGYVTVTLMNSHGVPFALGARASPASSWRSPASCWSALLYARLYSAGELEQVLFTIGLDLHGDRRGAIHLGAAAAAHRACRTLRGRNQVGRVATSRPTASSS